MFYLCYLCLLAYSGVHHTLRCVFYFACLLLVYPMLQVSLDCPCLFVPSVFAKCLSIQTQTTQREPRHWCEKRLFVYCLSFLSIIYTAPNEHEQHIVCSSWWCYVVMQIFQTKFTFLHLTYTNQIFSQQTHVSDIFQSTQFIVLTFYSISFYKYRSNAACWVLNKNQSINIIKYHYVWYSLLSVSIVAK